MQSPVHQDQEIEQLKTLLFHSEEARLNALETQVASLQTYVGGSERLAAATAEVLITALARAEVDRPRDLANAIAPSVVTAIRREIANSREMMVEALYPITGRLVQAAVANAFKELLAFIEQRLNALTSTELWVGRIKSVATGRPISEFVMADSATFTVNRLLLIERKSGRLVTHWTREGVADDRADMLSAMVAAILEFSTQAMSGGGELQKLDFGGSQFALRSSARYVLAAECVGTLRPADDARISELFLDMLEAGEKGATADAAMLGALAAPIEARKPAAKPSQRGKIILFAVLGVLAAAILWQVVVRASQIMVEQRAGAALEQVQGPWMNDFPLRLDFDHPGQTVTVSGIQPSDAQLGPMLERLERAASPYRVVNRIGVLQGAGVEADVDGLRQAMQALQQRIEELEGTSGAAVQGQGVR